MSFFDTQAGSDFAQYTVPDLTRAVKSLHKDLEEGDLVPILNKLTKKVDDLICALDNKQQILCRTTYSEMEDVIRDGLNKGYLYVNHIVIPDSKEILIIMVKEGL